MSETLQISKENAVKAFDEANQKGKKLLSDLFGKKTFLKDVCERIQGWDDILTENGITQEQFDEQCKGLTPDEIGYRKVKLIVTAYNEGWLPDFSDSNERKWFPYFTMGSPSGVGFSYYDYAYWYSVSYVGSRLVYKELRLLQDAVSKFLPEYKEFFTK